MSGKTLNYTKIIGFLLFDILALYQIQLMLQSAEYGVAAFTLFLFGVVNFVFFHPKAYSHRYILPAVLAVAIFVIFPLLHTFYISFTTYNAKHVLTLERAQSYFLQQTYRQNSVSYPFSLYGKKGDYQIGLTLSDDTFLVSQSFALNTPPDKLYMAKTDVEDLVPLPLKEVIKNRKVLGQLRLELPAKAILVMDGLRKFSAISSKFTLRSNNELYDNEKGFSYLPNFDAGFYESGNGDRLSPGFRYFSGLNNYQRIIEDKGISKPFVDIFIWTVVFAALSVLFTLIVGVLLACVLHWDAIKYKALYRTFLILPYAVPSFISILVFKGIFNQNFGEINLLLEMLFGVKPQWFSDPFNARAMILIVNTWLGYPYIMLLSLGMLQAISKDGYEASAIEGAGVLTNFFKITLPQIIRPLAPLLISSFAFNFNNFVLIGLLTGGGPDMIGASTPVGMTDILVSYTYRLAFVNSAQDFALASAISTIIFVIVSILAVVNLKVTKTKLS